MAGAPRKITALGGTTFSDKVMKQLKESFRDGLNNGDACLDANISEKTFYTVMGKNPNLKRYFELLQKNISKIARQNIATKIKKNDTELSKWYLERKDKSFKQKTDITSDDQKIGITVEEIALTEDTINTFLNVKEINNPGDTTGGEQELEESIVPVQ